jgi:hypothetical protein
MIDINCEFILVFFYFSDYLFIDISGLGQDPHRGRS